MTPNLKWLKGIYEYILFDIAIHLWFQTFLKKSQLEILTALNKYCFLAGPCDLKVGTKGYPAAYLKVSTLPWWEIKGWETSQPDSNDNHCFNFWLILLKLVTKYFCNWWHIFNFHILGLSALWWKLYRTDPNPGKLSTLV